MVHEKESGEEHCDHAQQVQCEIQGFQIGRKDNHRKGEHKLESCRVVAKLLCVNHPDKVVVKYIGIGSADAQIEDHHKEVTLIGVTNATGREHAMMVSLQDACIADVAMPGTGWTQGFTGGTKTPHFEVGAMCRGC